MKWSEGYYTDINYSRGYYRQLNPAMLRLAVLAGGFEPPRDDGFNYLELGFGQGVSIAYHAASSDASYWGTDFNPSHAANAIGLTEACGVRAHFFDDSFKEFAARPDLPEFDYIALHGIWSWISDENRKIVIDLIRRKLRTGGAVYVSYNIYPGWGPRFPVRQLMSLFNEKAGSLRGKAETIHAAVEFTKDVFAAGADFYKDVPALAKHLNTLNGRDASYIAHEYLNRDWKISTFADVSAELAEAKLTYAGPTDFLDHVEPFRFTPEGRKILSQIGDPALKETTKDFLTNQMFRCDVYVKGARSMTKGECVQRWVEQWFVLTTHKDDMPQEIQLPLGKIHLHEKVPRDLIDALADSGYLPQTIAQLRNHPALAHASFEQIIESLILLIGAGHVCTAQHASADIVARCKQLNRHVRERALVTQSADCLVSPVTGGGIHAPHICLLFLNAMDQGRDTVQALSQYVWEFLEGAGERMLKDGKRLESRQENLEIIEPLAGRFLATMLPMLKAMQVV